jgi:Carboxypeptidase regulatory-like domain/TonB dependent receptor-like, beta-barrel/TonB-dependent Receptor Plug Domain
MRQVALLFLACLLVTSLATAQSPNGTISGIVVDPSGAVIVGAEVVIENDATGLQYPAKTNGEGIYVVPNLPPGTYRLQVSKIGFKTLIKPHITLNVQGALAINFTLPIGAASEIVTVRGGAPLVNTQSASVSTVIDRQFVENLPLNGRSFNTLLQLTPGVVIAPSNNFGENPGQFSIAGQRTDANNVTVDGVSANFGVSLGTDGFMGAAGTGSAQAFSALGGTSSLVSADDLQEFRIETSSFAPEFGRQPGGQVILSTRSGTNSFHGAIYEYFRNDVMDANNWFANQRGLPRAAERHNDFGGIFGGPIFRDKTFFFLSYEGARLREPQTVPIQVPSAYARSYAATNAPALLPFLNAYPQPDDKTAIPGVYASQFTGNYSIAATLNAGSIRIDHKFDGRFSIFGRFNDAPSLLASPTLSLSTLQSSEVDTRTLTLGVNMLLSPRVANFLRGNYSKQSADTVSRLTSLGGAVPLSPSLLFGTLSSANTFGDFSLGDLGGDDLQFGPIARNEATQLNFVDDLSLMTGLHQFKFGVDYRAIFTKMAPPENAISFSADSVQSLLASGQGFLFAVASAGPKFLSTAFSAYAQDTWKATPRLTLVYGVRWELSPAPSPRGSTVFAAWQNLNNPAAITLAPPGTSLWKPTYGNFAPRLGIAYSLTKKGDLVLRAGGGVFYDLGVGNAANVASTFPNGAVQFTPNVTLPATNLAPYLPSISLKPPYGGLIFAFSPNLKLPRSYQWNVALEKSFRGQQVISATYVGQSGQDLLREEGLLSPNSNFQPGTFFFVIQNNARSNYNALQLQYRRPVGSRLQALLSYTWSHSLDDASDDTASAISDTVVSSRNDWGSSSFDVRHSFSGAVTYNVPAAAKAGPLSLLTKDWALATLVVARSGFPFNGVLFTNGRIGAVFPRPDLVPGQPFWLSTSGAPGGKALNPAAFSAPPVGHQGDEGRNDIPGFGFTQVDLSLGRKFPISERVNLQFRADAFNVLNHPNFSNPLAYIGFGPSFLRSSFTLNNGLGGLNPLFQEGGPRSLQLSLRLAF